MIDTKLLSKVTDVGRTTLLDLDPRDVPQTLVRVAQQTGKRLAPPLARRLLEEIDMNEWLRGEVANRFGPLTDSDDPTVEAAGLFLHRPEGWEGALAEIAASDDASKSDDEVQQLRDRVRALEHELDAARGKARRAQREVEMARSESEKRIAALKLKSRSGREADQEALDSVKRENTALLARMSELARDHEDLSDRLKRVRGELLKARRAERPADVPPPTSVWADLDALGSARLLDEVATALAPPSEFEETPLPLDVAEPEQLPSGVAPDSPEAITWLLERTAPFVLIVDGYNVTFLVNRDTFTRGDARDNLNRQLARFRREAASTPRVVVVYDSDQLGGISTEAGPGGVELRYTSADHSADDEVLVMATELGGRAVVVSTDRRVREGAEAVGSLGLWSQALVGWFS